MASPAQITANQANATRSTGPRTAEGKAAASHNACNHGATSRQNVLAWESQSQFECLAADTQSHYRPQGHHELALTTLVAVTFWRYNRLLRLEAEFMSAIGREAATIDSANAEIACPEAAVAALFADPAGAKKLSLVLRYLANASREWRSAVTELRRVQKENRGAAEDLLALNQYREAGGHALLESAEPAAPPLNTPQQSQPLPQRPPVPVHTNRAERRAVDLARRNAEKRARCAAASVPSSIGFDSYSAPKAA